MGRSNGLNGEECGFFCNLWKGIKKNALAIFGGAVSGGPLGAIVVIITIVADTIVNQRGAYNVSPANEPRLDAWLNSIFLPLTKDIFILLGEKLPETYLTQNYILRFNKTMVQLAALQAYYEYKAQKATAALDIEMYQAQATGVSSFAQEIRNWYLEVVAKTGNATSFNTSNFEATTVSNVGNEYLNWGNARTVVALKYHLGAVSSGGGGTISAKPGSGTLSTSGGSQTGGGSKDTGNNNGGGMVYTPPIVPDPKNDPIINTQTNTPNGGTQQTTAGGQNTTEQPKTNKKLWIGFAAIATYFIFK